MGKNKKEINKKLRRHSTILRMIWVYPQRRANNMGIVMKVSQTQSWASMENSMKEIKLSHGISKVQRLIRKDY